MEASDLGKHLKASSNWYRIRNIDNPEEVIRLWVSCAHCEQPLIDEEILEEIIAKANNLNHWLTLAQEEFKLCDCLERRYGDEDSDE